VFSFAVVEKFGSMLSSARNEAVSAYY